MELEPESSELKKTEDRSQYVEAQVEGLLGDGSFDSGDLSEAWGGALSVASEGTVVAHGGMQKVQSAEAEEVVAKAVARR